MSLRDYELYEEDEEEEVEEHEYGTAEFRIETPRETGVCYLLSVTYSGASGKALLKLYDPSRGIMVFWYDNTGHKPYCLTNLPPSNVLKVPGVASHRGFDHVEEIEKYDLLHDRKVRLTKVVAKDPLSVGGAPNSLRDILRKHGAKVWEAKIRYHNCYIYDRQLIPGMPYRIVEGRLVPVKVHMDEKEVEDVLRLWKDDSPEEREMLREWLPLFQTPVPVIRRVAIDIEVYSPIPDRVPNPKDAKYPVICVAMVSNDGLRRVLVLRRKNVSLGDQSELPQGVEVKFYDDERAMLLELFKVISEYPVVLTFNGDNFDFNYLWHRALQLGFSREQIPIYLTRDSALLHTGVHIDLYRFFGNKSIQVYAFGGKYKETTLDAIAEALLGEGKMVLDRPIPELPIYRLAAYCYRDAELTLGLTMFENDLVMKLIILFMRISKLSMEDLVRQGISGWIKNLFYYEHRKRNYLIPEPDDILSLKGVTVTKAIIKGKKYMGALVMKPKAGVHFNVVVVDFASLYPSVIKQWNLSYETVRCPHEECRSNLVPETSHWVCRKRRGLTALIVGLLRDLRVRLYKKLAKSSSLPEEEREWYDVVQRALKVFINASYGVFGASTFPLYCPPVAESTTAIGRYAIKRTLEKAQELGLEVIYGDTDSLFIKNPPSEKVSNLIKWAEKELKIDLDVDKVYRYVTLSERKKNYLGVLESGSVEIKGLLGKKRNTPEFLKQAFANLIKILAEVRCERDFEEAKDKIRVIVHDCYMRLKNRRYSLEDLAFKMMLSKPLDQYIKSTPQHVKAAQQLVKVGYPVEAGDIIAFVKVKGSTGVKPVQLARIDEIDEEKYLAHIESTFEQVLDALGMSFNEVISGAKLLDFK
ncbi:MAG: DNA-directed DNA polymerase I [Thermoprotei archaeon]|nr:MAG: DNA-directed DNA polymerase I [Thermoprotei archaeon]RLF25743.1 MAG: DNA-directed DNA polymerase I [Thermoprotei archaeon]